MESKEYKTKEMIQTGINTEGEKAGQEWIHIVCDHSGIILHDSVTLYPGFIEIRGGELIQHNSADPNNDMTPFLLNAKGEVIGKNPDYTLGMLKNRVEFETLTEIGPAPEGAPGTGHFLDLDVLHHFIASRAVPIEEDPPKEVELPDDAATEPVPDEPVTPDETGDSISETSEESVAPEVIDAPAPEEDAPAAEPSPEEVPDDLTDETPIEEPSTGTSEEAVADPGPDAPETPEAPTPETPDTEASVLEVPTAGSDESDGRGVVEDPTEPVGDPDTSSTDESTGSSDGSIPEETPLAPEGSEEVTGPHWVDVNGITRCSACMLAIGAFDNPDAHIDAENGITPPEPEPAGDMMTTETHP